MMEDYPSIAARMSGDDGQEAGGLVERKKITFEDHAHKSLQEAFSACRLVDGPMQRGRLITLIEAQLADMKRRGQWIKPPPSAF